MAFADQGEVVGVTHCEAGEQVRAEAAVDGQSEANSWQPPKPYFRSC